MEIPEGFTNYTGAKDNLKRNMFVNYKNRFKS